jgi:hypothetical protein
MHDTLLIALFPVSRRIRARLGRGADNIGVLSGIVNGMETRKRPCGSRFCLLKTSDTPLFPQGFGGYSARDRRGNPGADMIKSMGNNAMA